jgi:hypothetical protein
MPQIWLTYTELGQLFNCNVLTARHAADRNSWPARRSSDGNIRVKLPPAAAHEFIISYARQCEERAPYAAGIVGMKPLNSEEHHAF